MKELGLGELRVDPEWKDAPDSADDGGPRAWWDLMLDAVPAGPPTEWQEVFDRNRKDVFAEIYRAPPSCSSTPRSSTTTTPRPSTSPAWARCGRWARW